MSRPALEGARTLLEAVEAYPGYVAPNIEAAARALREAIE